MNLFNKDNITLSSGLQSDFKIDCDALTDADIECIAHLISKRISFDSVRGVPTGGTRLAKALEKYSTNTWQRIVLIVDDVLTTGGSMERMKKEILSKPHHKKEEETLIKGCVVFSRGECPSWITPLFKMWDI